MGDITKRLICRRATHADYGGVMAINDDVYGGLDYLPIMYHQYIDDPLRQLYVAVLDKEIVGFNMMYVVDDGKSMIGMAARVRPSLQGRGINQTLGEFGRLDTRRRFPGIRRLMWTTINPAAAASSLRRSLETRLLTVRPRFSLDVTCNELLILIMSEAFKHLLTGCKAQDTGLLTAVKAQALICDVINIDHFLPEGTWIIDWEPFAHCAANYPIIFSKSALFATDSRDTGETRALSFLSSVKVKSGLRVRADFYHRENDYDIDVLLAHVLHHLMYLSRRYVNLTISYSILYPSMFFPASYAKNKITDVLGLGCKQSPEAAALLLESRLDGIDAKL